MPLRWCVFRLYGDENRYSIISPILIIGLVSFVISVFGLLLEYSLDAKHNMRVELWGTYIDWYWNKSADRTSLFINDIKKSCYREYL